MKENFHESYDGIFTFLLQHPAIQEKIVEFLTLFLGHALTVSEVREKVFMVFTETELFEMLNRPDPARPKESSIKTDGVKGRQQVTAKEAAQILRYNPHYFSRKAKSWGLTKIRMSRTSCRYYLDEIERLAIDRGIRISI